MFIVKNNISLCCWLFNVYLFGTNFMCAYSQTLVAEPNNVNFVDKWFEGGDSWDMVTMNLFVCW